MATEHTHEQEEEDKYAERDTGMSNRLYNLVSVLYHALQSAETAGQYVDDAESEGDEELAKFFRDVIEEQRDCAEHAKELLAARLGGDGLDDFEDEDESEGEGEEE